MFYQSNLRAFIQFVFNGPRLDFIFLVKAFKESRWQIFVYIYLPLRNFHVDAFNIIFTFVHRKCAILRKDLIKLQFGCQS